MNKHTPGPWRWWITVGGARVAGHPADGSKNFVCDVLIPEDAVSFTDNARLIAAAPDLLVALIKFDSVMRRASDYPDTSSEISDLVKAVEGARKAIAKATGENNA